MSSNTSTLFPIALTGVPGRTIVRIRGEVNILLTVASTFLGGFPVVAVGLGIVTAQALGGGAASVPAPFTDVGWDGWMWYWKGSMLTNNAFTLPSNEGPSSARIVIDSKAMRKWGENDSLIAVVETSLELGASVLALELNTRVLEKLP